MGNGRVNQDGGSLAWKVGPTFFLPGTRLDAQKMGETGRVKFWRGWKGQLFSFSKRWIGWGREYPFYQKQFFFHKSELIYKLPIDKLTKLLAKFVLFNVVIQFSQH